jgi:choline dehydrogenase-like flavoprotein
MEHPSSSFSGESEVLDLCVVGSGPAGVCAASALIQKGGHVTLLDGRLNLEPQIADSLRTLSQQPSEDWDSQLINKFKYPLEVSPKGVPLKYLYGSDFRPLESVGMLWHSLPLALR